MDGATLDRAGSLIARTWAWLAERWTTGAEPTARMIVLALIIVGLTVLVPQIWLAARNAVTIVHEMGHVVAAKVCGRSISGIRLHTDTSGLAVTRGRPDGPGMLLTSLAGYPAPGVVGLGMTWAATSGRAGAALLLLVVLLVLAVLLVRNLWGALIVVASLVGAWLVLQAADALVVTALVLALGVFLATGSLRAVWGLCREHWRGQAGQSDAVGAAASAKVVPASVWLGFFLVATGACAVGSLWMVIGTLLEVVRWAS